MRHYLFTFQIHVYQDTFVVDVIRLDEVPTAIRFGHFGREEGALIIVTRGGSIHVCFVAQIFIITEF